MGGWGGNFTHSPGGGFIRCLGRQTHLQCGKTLKMVTPRGGHKMPGPKGSVTAQAGHYRCRPSLWAECYGGDMEGMEESVLATSHRALEVDL